MLLDTNVNPKKQSNYSSDVAYVPCSLSNYDTRTKTEKNRGNSDSFLPLLFLLCTLIWQIKKVDANTCGMTMDFSDSDHCLQTF